MNSSTLFLCNLVLLQCTGEVFAGKVVFLRGSGCAGKTSLCSQLIKQDSSWKWVEEDGIYHQEAAVHWQNQFPVEFAAIKQAINAENILHAILRNQHLFKSDASNEQRLKAKSAIATIQETLNSRDKKEENGSKTSWAAVLRNQITQTILDHAQEHNVIVDTWFLKSEHIQRIADNHTVVHIVAYSSFAEVVKRTIKRNYTALMNGRDISNLRFFHQALKSFTGTYDLSDTQEGSIAILHKEAVIQALDLVELQLQNSPEATGSSKTFTRGEFSVQEFQEYRESLLGKFKAPTAYIVPNSSFDMVLITDDCDPAEAAKRILNFVGKL